MGTDFLVNIKIILQSKHRLTLLSELCLVSTIIFIFKTISLNTEKINKYFGLNKTKIKNYSILVLKKNNNYFQTYLHYLTYHKWC